MITPRLLRHAIKLMRSAPCIGDDSKEVAITIEAFEALYAQMVAPPPAPEPPKEPAGEGGEDETQ